MSTIAAISTPQASGGTAMIRVSGDNALEIAASVFKPTSTKKSPTDIGRTLYIGLNHPFHSSMLYIQTPAFTLLK